MNREQFENLVEKIPEAGCWIWKKGITGSGYGALWYREETVSAHRFSYIMYKGPIPRGLHVLHRCDVKLCVNPDHLYTGTEGDNMRDASNRGRLEGNGRIRQTHCKRGHEYTEQTSYLSNGKHCCKICIKLCKEIRKKT
jgi:hypothetical protein